MREENRAVAFQKPAHLKYSMKLNSRCTNGTPTDWKLKREMKPKEVLRNQSQSNSLIRENKKKAIELSFGKSKEHPLNITRDQQETSNNARDIGSGLLPYL